MFIAGILVCIRKPKDDIALAGKLFQVTGAAYKTERLANTVFVLGTVSSGRAAERVWQVKACWTR